MLAQALLREFLVSADCEEAACRVRMLDAPHYGHELVKRALLACFERPGQAPALLGLLRRLAASGQVSQVRVWTRMLARLRPAPSSWQGCVCLVAEGMLASIPLGLSPKAWPCAAHGPSE